MSRPPLNIPEIYAGFNAPAANFDCGLRCAPYNPRGIPFCCDICCAVPVAYTEEWEYLQRRTNLWHPWRGDECAAEPEDPSRLEADTPAHMRLLACLGPQACQREYRSITCRQFPFFPYITADDRFIGLAYHWDFEPTCWLISHLDTISPQFLTEFVETYDKLLLDCPEDYDSYYYLSEEMRAAFIQARRRIPLLHRAGGFYLLSPRSGRLSLADPGKYRRFGPYRNEPAST